MNESIVKLRKLTQAGIVDIKNALDEAGGDEEKAIEILRKKGEKIAFKKQDRVAREGTFGIYLHTTGKLLSAVELLCETDFVARTDEFKSLARDLAMHIAAMSPLYLSEGSVPPDIIDKEKEIYFAEMQDSGKPQNVIEKIVEGKLKKFYEEVCLLNQKYLKDDSKTVGQMVSEHTAKLGEKIVVANFLRLQI